MFRLENDCSLENFCASMVVDLYIVDQEGHNSWENIHD